MTQGALFVVDSEAPHRCKITLKKNPELPILRNELDPRDQRADRFSSLRPSGLVLQAGVKSAEECQHDLLAINVSSASSAFSRSLMRLRASARRTTWRA
ncbi:hypothetical protein [Gluconobacter cerinus]|uniref:hypothetical protein n=1 Tax=Gluconobacter cerinus TaxID=38307 RepID=UPI001B8B61AC|nr:hypothetical protein [Gluconobacter cerinus]MBS1068965.1 hypothetical protein [Gluconobacter cerinus]